MIVQEKARIDFLDVVRGIAAVAVLIAHTSEIFFPESVAFWNNYLNLGQVGVVSFFLVSGFVIPFSLEKSNSLYAFFLSRIFRIYPLYLFVIAIGFLLLMFGIRPGYTIFQQNLWVNISSHFLFAQEYLPEHKFGIVNLVNGSWTLFLEAFWYCLFAFLFLIKSNKKTEFLLLLVNGAFLFLSITSFLSDTRLPLGRIGMLFNCMMGLLAYRFFTEQTTDKVFKKWFIVSLINLGIGIWVAFGWYKNELFSLTCVLISWSVAYVLFFVFFFLRNKKVTNNKLVKYLGTISYSVYLLHPTWILLVREARFSPALSILSVTGLTIISARFVYAYVEKTGINLGKNLVN